MNFGKEDDDILLLLVVSGLFYQNQNDSVGKILVTTQHEVFITAIYQK